MKYIYLFLYLFIVLNCSIKKDSLINQNTYVDNKEFIFEYYYFDQNNHQLFYKFLPPFYNINDGHEKEYNWILTNNKSKKSLEYVHMQIIDGKVNEGQNVIEYKYVTNNEILAQEITGFIKKKNSVWIHPPRTKGFRILELTPFPYVDFSKRKWNQTITIGGHWGDKRWKEWNNDIVVKNSYENTGIKTINTSFGLIKCYETIAIGSSSLGKSKLKSYYNEKYGFVRLEYNLINKAILILNLVEIRDVK